MNLRILIIDDSVTMRRITAAIVSSRHGWTVCGEAEDGLSGVQKFQELKPDLVLLDFGMPGINGIETASRMSTVNPRVPIILFTVWDWERLAGAAAKAGIYALVSKREAWTLLARIESASAPKSNVTSQ
jgi:DNA-binding NarL/FixJ family response regulator